MFVADKKRNIEREREKRRKEKRQKRRKESQVLAALPSSFPALCRESYVSPGSYRYRYCYYCSLKLHD
jgi:hypothetical protein